MNLLFLTQTYPRFEDDTAGPFIRDLARGLVAGGDRVTVLTPHAEGVKAAWDDGGVRVTSFRYAPEPLEVIGYSRSLSSDEKVRVRAAAAAPLYLRGARRAVAAELGRERYDLLQGHWAVPNGLVAAAFGHRLTAAMGLHGSDVFLAEKPLARSWVARALRRTKLVTGCSPELVDRVCALGFPRRSAHVIPYGVDPQRFSPDPQRRAEWRRRLGIPDDAPVVLTVGRMVTKKGYQVLFDALPGLLRAQATTHVVFAGAGDRLEEFRDRAAPWPERVHLPGAVLRDTLPDLYRAADVFVLPAVHDSKGNVDGLPNVILEAMASGLPVVASSVSGIPLAVEEGGNGYLVPEGEAEPLARRLAELVSSPVRAREMGKRSRRKVERELTWTAVAARYREAYREATSRAGTA